MPIFTPEDLLQYLYKETSQQENTAIEAALSEDWALREKYEVLLASANSLNSVIESPREEVVSKLLNYARKTMRQPA
jgi:anti-sigma factor RsiW